MAQPNIPAGFDFTDPDIYAHRLPVEELAEVRKAEPVYWVEQPDGVGGFNDGGYWLVTRHEDIRDVSMRDVFSTWENTAIPRFADDMKREQIELQRFVLLNKDAPEHTKLRKLVSRGFTPRAINGIKEELRDRAESIVKAAAAEGSGDFVTQVAAELPLQAIAELIGVPQEDRGKVFEWSNQMTSYDDPEFADIDPAAASMEILGYAYQLAEARKANPGDDLVTTLIEADVDGDELSPEEFGFFVIVLAVAGNETTRNATTHGMKAFMDNPEQWELYKKERPKTTADEIIRWATPVAAFQRTALEDTEIGGVAIKKGQRVVMNYVSANFDEEVFENPEKFDILRDPNPHLSFGGTGAHYCLGANLARMEIDLIFNAIADFLPDITEVGATRRLRSGWLNGIKEYQVDYKTGGCPVAH
ncbi:cholest-4-en-3-one 26-monooxygenase [Rhodococcus sp. PvR044]|uniref:cytochrome P450 n=1 Tax=Rhodococcus TaxID=1827 RepID=UPI0009794AFF|nr:MULTISPECIES: cytochrome P450 [Rhodococcus]AQA23137.1 steroid C26-monooxygenase [Rhodococcus sp. MTM3W5.2]MBP1160759.1 cholest-4-en-3-one 26-monooxygenase [Rhodococcus sp. PvR099]MCZ4556505.1 cytochrome P450 [Rhodococcus maanshanensis]PTR42928.1 cholest-4-en-3-one 26-monooxygenase [Rhodococcus sp. OK611]SNX91263.1 cholest-4-en-3-one 26-monooxygenase [Rhodococcus sp. OK270]